MGFKRDSVWFSNHLSDEKIFTFKFLKCNISRACDVVDPGSNPMGRRTAKKSTYCDLKTTGSTLTAVRKLASFRVIILKTSVAAP
jgi:hypothetical protein